MRLVRGWLDTLKHTRRDDPVFDSMIYMGKRLKYWEGKAFFEPTGAFIEVFVDGLPDDDMGQQHDFFQQVVKEWHSLRKEIGDMLLMEWQKYYPAIPIESPWDLFRLSSISIPKGSIESAEWEMCFTTENHLWAVRIKGRQPQQVSVDG
jgi:hypothetical protein